MDIKFEDGVKTELFCNIGIGECFATDLHTPDELVCMRIYHPKDSEDNAVDLQNGEVYHFEDDEVVIPIDAELKVRLDG